MKWLYLAFTLFVKFAASGNPEENEGVYDPDLYEGDMILTPDQRMAAELGLDVDNPIGRGATKYRLWPGGVMVYVIDSSLSKDSRAVRAIGQGMTEWSSKTCIRFKKRTKETAYVNFKLGSGCSSYVGRIGWPQHINLARGCWTRGIVAHEIGHALGLYHEQSRPDRDKYVTILWDNIKTGRSHNFKKYNRGTIDSLGSPYDYRSVMHYGSKAFSKNGKPTIVAKPNPKVTLGQRKGISATDAKQMNLLYKSPCGVRCEDKATWCRYVILLCNTSSKVRAYCKKTCKRC